VFVLGSLASNLCANLISEGIGIVIESVIVAYIVNLILQRREIRRWSPTRQSAGKRVGWAHTALEERLRHGDNAFVALYEWTADVLDRIKQVRERYGYSFTAEMASNLEFYEMGCSQTRLSLTQRQFRNLDSLDYEDEALISFLKACGLPEREYEPLIWSSRSLEDIKRALSQANLEDPRIPALDPLTPLRM